MQRIAVAWLPHLPAHGNALTALVLALRASTPAGFTVIRHADAGAVAQAGACSCCRVPSGIAVVLRQLFLDRVRGIAEFDDVLVASEDIAAVDEAMQDPLVAARYAFHTSGQGGPMQSDDGSIIRNEPARGASPGRSTETSASPRLRPPPA